MRTGYRAVLAMTTALVVSAPLLAVELESPEARYSYAVGLRMGASLKQQQMDVDPQAFSAGVADALSGAEPRLNREEMSKVMQERRDKQREQKAQQAKANLEKGQAFLAENKSKEGVVELPGGLQYLVLEEGEGEPPAADDKVTVHYRGTLIDGTEFDSSYSRGQPATFALNGVIKGFSEALKRMKPGSKWRVFIPADMAYGTRGSRTIGPNEALIFEMELISYE